MRQEKWKQMVQFLILLSVLIGIISVCQPLVLANNYSISLKNTGYEQTKTTSVGSETIQYYTIYVILTNEGPDHSDNITVELIDEYDIPVTKDFIIPPGESKTYYFKDIPFTNEEFTINYYPTNQDIDKTSTNSGSTTIQLSPSTDSDNSTPSVSLIVILSSILILSFLIKKRRTD